MERREKRKWHKTVGTGTESTIWLLKPPCFQFLHDAPDVLRLVLRASRFTLHLLSFTILILNLILPVDELAAQTDPASTAEEAVSDEQTEAVPETPPTEDPPTPEAPNDGEVSTEPSRRNVGTPTSNRFTYI